MTSAINYLAINENFPVAGQDNDTQVFRDNFDTIKTNFRLAKDEITDLQNTAARINADNSFDNNLISEAIFVNNKDKKWDAGFLTSNITVDYEQGAYHVYRIGANVSMEFLNFPTNNDQTSPLGIGVGKLTLELYGDGAARNVTLSISAGSVFKRNSAFPGTFPTFSVTSTENPVIIEVWRHNSDTIFVNYLGQFI
jgi:hypothetical protein